MSIAQEIRDTLEMVDFKIDQLKNVESTDLHPDVIPLMLIKANLLIAAQLNRIAIKIETGTIKVDADVYKAG